MRKLGVLCCYNDGDILQEAIENLLNLNHHLIVWDHGSDDCTSKVLDHFDKDLLERRFLPRSHDFYRIYPTISKYLISNYSSKYDWISWPDVDEFLEGLNRSKTYDAWLHEVYDSEYDWIQFNNMNYWFTSQDNPDITRVTDRIRFYSIFQDCAPRIRSWRRSKTNIRKFNHNPVSGIKYPANFNLRHYPMRDLDQMMRRLLKDRVNLERNGKNFHYKNMEKNDLLINSTELLFDDGVKDLLDLPKFNWSKIYGVAPQKKINF